MPTLLTFFKPCIHLQGLPKDNDTISSKDMSALTELESRSPRQGTVGLLSLETSFLGFQATTLSLLYHMAVPGPGRYLCPALLT